MKDEDYDPGVENNEEETEIEKQISETRDFFENLKIKEENIKQLEDSPKEDITDYFDSLIQTSTEFEKANKDSKERQVLAIIVRWIGFDVTHTPIASLARHSLGRRPSKDLLHVDRLLAYE